VDTCSALHACVPFVAACTLTENAHVTSAGSVLGVVAIGAAVHVRSWLFPHQSSLHGFRHWRACSVTVSSSELRVSRGYRNSFPPWPYRQLPARGNQKVGSLMRTVVLGRVEIGNCCSTTADVLSSEENGKKEMYECYLEVVI